MDALTEELLQNVLSEEDKAFNEHIIYANETSMKEILLQARQFPMMSDYQLIIVKEAQHLSKQINDLDAYVKNPLSSTILVFNYKYGKPDGRNSAIKTIKKNFVFTESAKIYEDKIPGYIHNLVKSKGLQIDVKAQNLLAENIGNNLARIHNEIEKLEIVLKDTKQITPELVEKHIGISKDYNNFELTKAISQGNFKQSFEIIKYFGQNPKNNSIYMTLGILFNFFSKVMIFHTLQDKSRSAASSALGVNPYFYDEYLNSARIFPLKKVTAIIGYLREADIKSKGVGATSSVSEEELMRELLFKIFN